MNISFFKSSFLIVFLSSIFFGFSQKINVEVLDANTNQPIEDALIRVSNLKPHAKEKDYFEFTDKVGKSTLQFNSPLLISISYIGYTPLLDTLKTATSHSYRLSKQNSALEDVVITGQYKLNSAKASVYDIKVFNEKDFRKKGANNLREALQGDLNIDLSQDAVFGSGISLQGISGEGVKIMVDGVPIVGRLDGKIDLSQITLSNIQRIEVVKGPLSAIYGTDAMGGVINLITKQNQTEKYTTNLKTYYESVGQYNAELNGSMSLKKSQFYGSVGRNFFDGYSFVKGTRHQDWRPKEQYFGDAKYVYTHSKIKATIFGSFFRELMLDRGNLQPYTTYAFDQHFLTMRPRGGFSFLIPIKDLAQLDALFSYSGYIRFYNNYQKDLSTLKETFLENSTQDTTVYHHLNARTTYTLNSKNAVVSFQGGVDINQEYTIQKMILNGRQQMGDYAAFVTSRIKPIKPLDIQAAVRFSYNTKYRTPLIPSINIRYEFFKNFVLRASYGRGFRAPSLKELYMQFQDSNHDIYGNQNLLPELGHSASLGLEYNLKTQNQTLKFSNAYFYNNIQNKIDLAITNKLTSPMEFTYLNLKSYITYGSEYKVDYSFKKLTLSAGVNYIQYQVKAVDSTVSFASPDVVANVGYILPKIGVNVNLNYKYTGKKLLYSLNNSIEAGTRNGFHSLSISMSRNFWKDRIQLTLGGKNLLNVTNVTAQNVSSNSHNFDSTSAMVNWGRTFFITLVFHFSK